jgi:hypothetical protein
MVAMRRKGLSFYFATLSACHACLHTGSVVALAPAGALVACLVAGNHVSKAAVKMARMLVNESGKDSVRLGIFGLEVLHGTPNEHGPAAVTFSRSESAVAYVHAILWLYCSAGAVASHPCCDQ